MIIVMMMIVMKIMIMMIIYKLIKEVNAGNEDIGFNNSVFLSERDTADR